LFDQGDRGMGILASGVDTNEVSELLTLRLDILSRVLPLTGIDNHEGIPPIKEPGEPGQRKPNGVRSSPRFCFSLDIKAELLSEKQVLASDSGERAETETKEGGDVRQQAQTIPNQCQAQASPPEIADGRRHRWRNRSIP
jgi:hypothetical protein